MTLGCMVTGRGVADGTTDGATRGTMDMVVVTILGTWAITVAGTILGVMGMPDGIAHIT